MIATVAAVIAIGSESWINLLAVVTALWLGEHVSGPRGLLIAAGVALTLAAIMAVRLWRDTRPGAILSAVAIVGMFALVWSVASKEATLAFNECVADGERVREALDNFHREHRVYPASLSQLDMHLPGYDLSFSDWLVTHEASEDHGFTTRK